MSLRVVMFVVAVFLVGCLAASAQTAPPTSGSQVAKPESSTYRRATRALRPAKRGTTLIARRDTPGMAKAMARLLRR